MPTYWFFERLGIPPTQDVKVIKRAYAVALKNIDQENDRAGFETLRKAYEQASAWAANHDDDEPDEDEWEEDEDELEADDGPASLTPDSVIFPPDVIPARQGYDVAPDPREQDEEESDDDEDTVDFADTIVVRPDPAQDALREQARQERIARDAALRMWIARLLDPSETSPDAVLDAALADEHMAHLDSQAQWEARIAEALFNDPDNRIALFEAASRRFGWVDRHIRPAGSMQAANWISRVINQDLQWREQSDATRSVQDAAVKAAMATGKPSRALAFKFTPVLDKLHEQFPEWLAIRLPTGRVGDWHGVYAALPPFWLRMARFRQRMATDRRALVRTTIGVLVAVSLLQGFGRLVIAGLFDTNSTTSPSQAQIPATATPAEGDASTEGPVLAYEFTGPLDKDSCESAHEFVHESNWLEIDDQSANALLTGRALLCQDQGKWPQANDPMLACLRAERIASLSANRLEDNKHCAPPSTGKK